MQSDKLERFTNLLKQIFELDKADLDFGIYRIMNLRKDTIADFLEKKLPRKVTETLQPYVQNDKNTLKEEISELRKQAKDLMGIEIEQLPVESPLVIKYNEKIRQFNNGTDLSALESEVYSSLFSFFNRYYDEGDFISKRRYKEGVYAIPYEGEEVKLYWANQDQYYIKSSENFKDYTFSYNGVKVHFRIVDATTEKNNNKESKEKNRYFMLYKECDEKPELKTFEYDESKKELYIRFVYDIPVTKIKKDELDSEINARVVQYIANLSKPELNPLIMSESPKEKTPIATQLATYVAKNSFDYFIHKNLRKFLNRELDFFIKNEVMHIDDLDTENEKMADAYIAKVRTIKKIGKIIIDFLAQIEDFQKKLWLKKKFIVSTNYCITLDKIDTKFYKEISENKKQCQEWKNLYSINEIVGWTEPPSIDFLKNNQHLIIDTQYFSTRFKDELISEYKNLDDEIDGLMVNGDNFQALNLLKNRYFQKIDCCYIDPPYNKETGDFAYKDNYKNSSWLTMMDDRISLTQSYLKQKARLMISIDDLERDNLKKLIDTNYNNFQFLGTITWEKRTKSQNTSTSKRMLQSKTEYILPYSMNLDRQEFNLESNGKKEYPLTDENGEKYRIAPLEVMSSESVRGRPSMIYPILGVLPGNGKQWEIGKVTVEDLEAQGRIFLKDNWPYVKYTPHDEDEDNFRPFWSHFFDKELYGTAESGLSLLDKDMGFGKDFNTVKPINLMTKLLNHVTSKNQIIMDYFAGSGTTGHAVIQLNRNEPQKRKYILVEMAEYFNKLTKPRIEKAIYSDSWKEGKPLNRKTGISQLVKYITLESYEDTLNNIALESEHNYSSLFGDDYLINYMFNFETESSLLKLNNFKYPFDYQMKIIENNETKKRNIDLVETFNYLVGLSINSISQIQRYNVTKKKNGLYEGAVELKENLSGEFGFKHIEGTLPDGKRALIIWHDITDNIQLTNAALDAYFLLFFPTAKDRTFNVIFTNGDNNLSALCTEKEKWTVEIIEKIFKQRMFEEK